jgi:hypothetical protein
LITALCSGEHQGSEERIEKLLALTLVDCRGGSKINYELFHNSILAMEDFTSSDEIFPQTPTTAFKYFSKAQFLSAELSEGNYQPS